MRSVEIGFWRAEWSARQICRLYSRVVAVAIQCHPPSQTDAVSSTSCVASIPETFEKGPSPVQKKKKKKKTQYGQMSKENEGIPKTPR